MTDSSGRQNPSESIATAADGSRYLGLHPAHSQSEVAIWTRSSSSWFPPMHSAEWALALAAQPWLCRRAGYRKPGVVQQTTRWRDNYLLTRPAGPALVIVFDVFCGCIWHDIDMI